MLSSFLELARMTAQNHQTGFPSESSHVPRASSRGLVEKRIHKNGYLTPSISSANVATASQNLFWNNQLNYFATCRELFEGCHTVNPVPTGTANYCQNSRIIL